jgi:hypothetical protein
MSMKARNLRRLGLFTTIALGRVPLRRRLTAALVLRSSRLAKAIVVGRVIRRAVGKPASRSISVRTPSAIIDVEAR